MGTDSSQDSIHFNIRALASCMRAHGAETTIIQYQGMGDDGQPFEVRVDDADAATKIKAGVEVKAVPSQGARSSALVLQPLSFDEACCELASQLIDANGNDGYENNEGGGGEITLNADGTLSYSHYDNIVTQEYTEKAYSVALEGAAAAPKVAWLPPIDAAANPVSPFTLGV